MVTKIDKMEKENDTLEVVTLILFITFVSILIILSLNNAMKDYPDPTRDCFNNCTTMNQSSYYNGLYCQCYASNCEATNDLKNTLTFTKCDENKTK